MGLLKRTGVICGVAAIAMAAPLAWAGAGKRAWTVSGKKAVEVPGVQYSDAPIIPVREVSFRSKFSTLNGWGALKAYPVVRAPSGKIYSGFTRSYAAGTLDDEFISWYFPVQFRSPTGKAVGENDAKFGDRLTESPEKLTPGTYQVKWVFNDRIVDTGDSFTYEYKETRPK